MKRCPGRESGGKTESEESRGESKHHRAWDAIERPHTQVRLEVSRHFIEHRATLRREAEGQNWSYRARSCHRDESFLR